MCQQKEGNYAVKKQWTMSEEICLTDELIFLGDMDDIIEKLTVKGSEEFTFLLIEKIKKSLGDRVVETFMKSRSGDVFAEISVECNLQFTRGFMWTILSALIETLKNDSVKMLDTIIISFEKYTLKVESDVLDAVKKGNEITYIMSYFISKDMKVSKKEKEIALQIIERYHDTLNSYFHKNALIVNGYHDTLFREPIPEKDIHRLCFDASYVISQFGEVQAIECIIKAAGAEEGHCN